MKKRALIIYLLLLTTVVVACMGLYLKQEVLTPLHLYDDKNVIEIPFVTLKDPMVRYVLRERNKADMVISTESETTEQIPVELPVPTELMVTEPRESTDPAPTEANFNEITEEWFDDALFIGDSRTVGLRDYARLGKADYFCNVGMSVFGVLEARESDKNFKETDLVGLLRQKKYNKIYISLGLNDSGAPLDLLMDAYHTLLRTVREEQPQAVVILQAKAECNLDRTYPRTRKGHLHGLPHLLFRTGPAGARR